MKRIVLCADGTWNEAERKDPETGRPQPTNVLKMARAVRPRTADGTGQVVYYHPGVGTGNLLDRFSGGAFGDGLEQNVRDLYRFISYNHEPGDEIYLFGFSRGAFTVRTLAGFLNRVGLIEKDDEYYTAELYGLYQSGAKPDSPEWQHAFRKVKPRPVPVIRCIGAWDTVGSLGAPGVLGQLFNSDKYKYHDVGLNASVRNAFHALAIDERRKPFLPSLWSVPEGWNGHLEQVWFAGVHANVGGSYHPDGLANEALQWMAGKAESLGLELDRAYLAHYTARFDSRLNNSMTAIYQLMGPVLRTLGGQPDNPHAVHPSAIQRRNQPDLDYAPANLDAFLKEQR